MLVIVPLVTAVSVIGAVGGGSSRGSSGSSSDAAPAGTDLMTSACTQIANLAGAASNNTATPASMLSDMQQADQYADQAAQANPQWSTMAADIAKLNSMVQSDSGDQTSFMSQLDTVSQECVALVAPPSSPPASGG
jgi:hypothetical protein